MSEQTCDFEKEDGVCGVPAVASYRFDWGQTGGCCPEHQIVRRQQADATNRTVQFVPVGAFEVPQVTSEERIQYHAKVLAAEDERDEAKKRAAEIYQRNTLLAEEVRVMSARAAKAEAASVELRDKLKEVTAERDTAWADAMEAQEEIARLRVVVDQQRPPE